ncbi:Telomere recombination/Putative GTP-binding controlling metal-binding, putative [Leishmania lindenbergi]|uniref:Threonylcarbamoyl-AMP synthase n=1 Tax=Leishmania lindenbergi TaxID=651832 RepID=A0AAW3A800_9TRYP
MAQIIGTSLEDLRRAADALLQGKLVAIPTETVYGLGGNALIESAAKRIYTVKGRPPTDPLICHVCNLDGVRRLWDLKWDEGAVELACAIGAALWPGPLTIVFKANPSLPDCVTGGSGYVGARIPNNAITLKLLEMVDVPVAAPSANTFGHVSPTTAQHVYDDLAARDPELLIIDGGQSAVGIESTVAKVESKDLVVVLRRGCITVSMIHRAIAERYPQTRVEIRDMRIMCGSMTAPMESPGQLLTHYSPRVPSSLLTPGSLAMLTASAGVPVYVHRGKDVVPLSETIVLDFNGYLSRFRDSCLSYHDMSPDGNPEEGCFAVFDALRATETVKGAKSLVFPFISEWPQDKENEDLLAAMEDRLFRAASGVTAVLINEVAPASG